MGVPYSKEVDIVLSSVQDLLGTVNYVAITLVILHITIVFLLILLLTAVIALIFTMDPNLSKEREALVTPSMKWLATRLLWLQVRLRLACWLLALLAVIALAGFLT